MPQAGCRLRRRRERGLLVEGRRTIYFNEGVRATNQLVALDVQKDTVRQITSEKAALSVARDEDTGVVLIDYSDGATPPTLFTVASMRPSGPAPAGAS